MSGTVVHDNVAVCDFIDVWAVLCGLCVGFGDVRGSVSVCVLSVCVMMCRELGGVSDFVGLCACRRCGSV